METRLKKSPENEIHFYLGREAISELLTYIKQMSIANIVLVSDENEYEALGARVESALIDDGFRVKNIILRGEEIGANEKYVVQALLPSDETEQLYISVGSGTVTDIVRFVSFRAKSSFISLPTAPSVDGFASNGSSMTIMDYKQTIISRPPLAIFADLETLTNAPEPLIAAGFGDMFGKFTALADWKLANLINGDPYNPAIADRSRRARDIVVAQSKRIKEDRETSISAVMEALYEEGLCMLEFGNSRPASGSEHSFSHYWEMTLHREGRPAVFHGSKVGLASIWISRYYEIIRNMSQDEAVDRLDKREKFNPDNEIKKMILGYGDKIAPFIIESQEAHLNLTSDRYDQIKMNIADNWEKIHDICLEVPSPQELISLIKNVGGATEPSTLGLTEDDIKKAMDFAQYIRKSFNILHMCQMLDCRPLL